MNNALAPFNLLAAVGAATGADAAAAVGVADSPWYVWISYLVAAALFILSLKWLSHPRTARRGVRAGEVGMAVAIVGTLLAEIKLANKGLGYVVIQHYNFFRTADMYAVLILIFMLAVGVNAAMDRLAARYSYKA